jgi:hypothetical protein
VNQNKNNMPTFIGALFGLVLSMILYFTQNIDFMFYFSAAPYYINSLTLKNDGIVGIITFIYFIGISSLLGYLFSLKLDKKFIMLAVFVLVFIHLMLVQFGGKTLFDGLPGAIHYSIRN